MDARAQPTTAKRAEVEENLNTNMTRVERALKVLSSQKQRAWFKTIIWSEYNLLSVFLSCHLFMHDNITTFKHGVKTFLVRKVYKNSLKYYILAGLPSFARDHCSIIIYISSFFFFLIFFLWRLWHSPDFWWNVDPLSHSSTTGLCSGPAHYDISIRQAARAAFVTSSVKIFLTQTFPRCGATCYNTAFEDDVSAIQWCQFCVSLSGSLLNILQLLTTLAICHVMF